jgi:hypothetical protein
MADDVVLAVNSRGGITKLHSTTNDTPLLLPTKSRLNDDNADM